MTTDEDKAKLAKLLQEIEVPDVKLSERCSELVKDFKQKFGQEVNDDQATTEEYDNPYRVDRRVLDEVDRKLQELLAGSKRAKKISFESILSGPDPKKPWRTNSSKEKLLRIENELKRHFETASDMIVPLADGDMKELVQECAEETRTAPLVPADRLVDTVEAARKNLPNFQYRRIENSTATDIFPAAHFVEQKKESNNDSPI